jgi:hypothetical protein
MSTMIVQDYWRFDFMIIVTRLGSILSLLFAFSEILVRNMTDYSIDKSMMLRLFSISKDATNTEADDDQIKSGKQMLNENLKIR